MKPFKNINETFTLEKFNEIEAIKNKTGLSWHDFIIHAANELRSKYNINRIEIKGSVK